MRKAFVYTSSGLRRCVRGRLFLGKYAEDEKPWDPLPGAHCCERPGLWRWTSPSPGAPFSPWSTPPTTWRSSCCGRRPQAADEVVIPEKFRPNFSASAAAGAAGPPCGRVPGQRAIPAWPCGFRRRPQGIPYRGRQIRRRRSTTDNSPD